MKLVLAFLLFSTSGALALNDRPEQPPPSIDPNKQVTVVLPVQDWQSVLLSIQDSARVSSRDANRINQTIINQVQAQIATASASKPKN